MPENKLYELTKRQKPQTSEWEDDPLELELPLLVEGSITV